MPLPHRRSVLQAGLLGGLFLHVEGAEPPPAFELDEIGLAELQEGLKSGKWTARALVEKYLARIEALDRKGPTLRSVIEINPDALALADALDKERKEKGPRSPLHGIPVLIKDNIDTSDKMATTAGSLALVGSKPKQDAFIVTRLRAAGAVLLGKTNLSEWANFRSSSSTSGWSGRGGQTRNPYALDRNPSGSSSGSGVAVAANLCAIAIGTETDGSIVSPSNANGIVGLKPTVGLLSRSGIIPIAHSQDTPGPMGRSVRDVAILLGLLTGLDDRDPATKDAEGKGEADYTKHLDAGALKGARLGVCRQFFGFNDHVEALMEDVLAALKKAGAELVDPVTLPGINLVGPAETIILQYEFKTDLNAYLATLGEDAPVKTLADVIAFNLKNRAKEMPFFGQDTLVKCEARGPLTDREYKDAVARAQKACRADGIDAVMEKHKLDALISPTSGPAAVTDLIYGGGGRGSCSRPAAVAGYPHLTVPAGFIFGLPVGLSFFGRAWSEATLLRLGYAFEQLTKARKAPRFLPTAELAV
jgi:amidase